MLLNRNVKQHYTTKRSYRRIIWFCIVMSFLVPVYFNYRVFFTVFSQQQQQGSMEARKRVLREKGKWNQFMGWDRLLVKNVQYENLILVPCYGVFVGTSFAHVAMDEYWLLENWMLHRGLESHWLEQIRVGVNLYKEGKTNSKLMFTGGETKPQAKGQSEAMGYLNIALMMDLLSIKDKEQGNVLLEERARDTMENMLYSICKFKISTGNYPLKITIVNYEFKRERTELQLRDILKFPNLQYVGTHSEGLEPSYLEMERNVLIPQFKNDPFGCAPPLSTKKAMRNPFHRNIDEYLNQCGELKPLLTMCD